MGIFLDFTPDVHCRPTQGAPHPKHPRLPYWIDLQITPHETRPTLAEIFATMALEQCSLASAILGTSFGVFAAPLQRPSAADLAELECEKRMMWADFLLRRAGIPSALGKVFNLRDVTNNLPAAATGIRIAFATLSDLAAFSLLMPDVSTQDEAANDPSQKPRCSVSFLHQATITAPPDTPRQTVKAVAEEGTIPTRPAANDGNIKPAAQILHFKKS